MRRVRVRRLRVVVRRRLRRLLVSLRLVARHLLVVAVVWLRRARWWLGALGRARRRGVWVLRPLR